MTLITSREKIKFLDVRGAYGNSYAFGGALFGKAFYGDFNDEYGIYQKKKTRKGRQISRMRFYVPSNPQSPAQVIIRSKFAMGVTSWQGLTDLEKEPYNLRARAKRMTGFNVFMSDYLRGN